MPLKDSTETKRWAVKKVEEVGWAVGQFMEYNDCTKIITCMFYTKLAL